MTFYFRQILIPILCILLASSVIVLGFVIVSDTAWANGLREAVSAEYAPPARQQHEETTFETVLRIIDAFLKVVLIMGIPALLTDRTARMRRRKGSR